jgi:hypothetical protein
LAYEEVMRQHYGAERTEEILGVNVHHVLVYPCLSVQSSLQQLRAVRPLGPALSTCALSMLNCYLI